ncbi:uncharacterized protein LODBEIA_P58060 [Lodderomyces beijingensis]|uniref:DUF1237 domain-containing protein n=1 Tax=Lodderomyces beijingensis TaxID=1775926 RepID=A0ABP0ZWL9_9ASCO
MDQPLHSNKNPPNLHQKQYQHQSSASMLTQSKISQRIRPVIIVLCVIITYLTFFRSTPQQPQAQGQPQKVPVLTQEEIQQHLLQSKLDFKAQGVVEQGFLQQLDKTTKTCPDYVEYSKLRHPPYSAGKRRFPYMRPAPKCRTFVSEAVEKLVSELMSRIRDPDLARLVENCLPNTLDTTILWHRDQAQLSRFAGTGAGGGGPQSFIVTGDIHAEWLRDAARQLSVYQPLVKYDPALKKLILGAIDTQAFFVNDSPYCNAFHPPPESGVKRGNTAFDDVNPRPNWRQVFECKYEIDSLASFLTLTNEYVENSGGDLAFLNKLWLQAYEKLLIVLRRESQPSFDAETGQSLPFYYSFQRQTNIGSETLPLGGVGNPVNYGTGLVRSAFRPSDDATILQFFIPGNIHMVTELKRARKNILNKEGLASVSEYMREAMVAFGESTDQLIGAIESGIKEFGIVEHPRWGKVFAYEVDGYGSATFMDDANIPSLLSIPDLGYTSVKDVVYQNTRKMILEKSGNPYYLKGLHFEGIGGPHIGIKNAWPMSLLVKIRTSDDDEEIMSSLEMVLDSTADLGLMHESVDVNSEGGAQYTRSWFAWCNSELGKTVLYMAKHKPYLIFKDEFKNSPLDIDAIMTSNQE